MINLKASPSSHEAALLSWLSSIFSSQLTVASCTPTSCFPADYSTGRSQPVQQYNSWRSLHHLISTELLYWNADQSSRRLWWVSYSPYFLFVKTDASVLMHEMWDWRTGFYRPAGISISWSSALRTHCSTRTRWCPLPDPSSPSRCAIPSFYTLLQIQNISAIPHTAIAFVANILTAVE